MPLPQRGIYALLVGSWGGQSIPLMSVLSQLSPAQNNTYVKDVWG